MIEEMKDESNNGKTAYIRFKLNIQDFGYGIPPEKIDKLFINFGNL